MGRNRGANYEIEREKYHLPGSSSATFVEKVRTAGRTNDFYLTANNNSGNKSILPELWDDIVQIPEYLDGSDRLGGFFWFGPAGTITPFHHDLTNNFMAQVIGRKRIKIAPSWDMPLMQNHLPRLLSQSTAASRRRRRIPASTSRRSSNASSIPGEILFLPIGCLHFVEGSISR